VAFTSQPPRRLLLQKESLMKAPANRRGSCNARHPRAHETFLRSLSWLIAASAIVACGSEVGPETGPAAEVGSPPEVVQLESTPPLPCEACCRGPLPQREPCARIVCEPDQTWGNKPLGAGTACTNAAGQSGACDGSNDGCASFQCVDKLENMGCTVPAAADTPYGWVCPSSAPTCQGMFQNCGCSDNGTIYCDPTCFPPIG
jgi:hypothetical protein